MKRTFQFSTFLFSAAAWVCSTVNADIVLTFDRNNISSFELIDQDYGDRVVATPDAKGHAYDIVPADELLTPNVEVSYDANGFGVALWTTGYGDLTNVLFAGDLAPELEINFSADPGFEVGLASFDLAAFGSTTSIDGIEVVDGNDNVLWSVGQTSISHLSSVDFDTSGVFSESLSIIVNLNGLGTAADNIGIDNIQFSQRTISAVPEPAGASILLIGVLGFASKRRRTMS